MAISMSVIREIFQGSFMVFFLPFHLNNMPDKFIYILMTQRLSKQKQQTFLACISIYSLGHYPNLVFWDVSIRLAHLGLTQLLKFLSDLTESVSEQQFHHRLCTGIVLRAPVYLGERGMTSLSLFFF